ncbi:MAG: ABC transporter ATP-binding protein [Bacillota bacterium]|nr:ABC transporter ATP-binding protein [Bacillota bacterium]
MKKIERAEESAFPARREGTVPLLEIMDLSISFRMYGEGLAQRVLEPISNLYLRVYPGEILALIGSSGSGKSLLAAGILGILPPNACQKGRLLYKGKDLNPERQAALRGREIALLPQSVSYLDPLMRVGAQVDGYRKPFPREKRRSIWKRFGLPMQTEKMYPYQLSGGMSRRVLLSTALLSEAELLIADEPTPGMSLEQSLEALRTLRQEADKGKAIILITHDIDLAASFADWMAFLYAGVTVELAPARDFREGTQALRHPYSQALWRALPQNGFQPIPGFQPYAGEEIPGCRFADRCPYQTELCRAALPPIRSLRGGEVRCYHGT